MICLLAEIPTTPTRSICKLKRKYCDRFCIIDGNYFCGREEQVCVEAEKMMEIPEEEDEDNNTEELCNCKFTLTYGTKILLHNN